jgi:hypothetical protein
MPLRARRGRPAIIHGNGLHKGRCAGAADIPATALNGVRLDFHGFRLRTKQNRWKQTMIRPVDLARFTRQQRLFADESAVVQ